MNTSAEFDMETLRQDYERDGYAVARGLLSASEITEIQDTFEAIRVHEREKTWDDNVTDLNDPLHQYPRVVHPHRFNATAKHYMLHPTIRICLEGLVGEELVAVQSMFYFKPPGARGQALHQDNLYLLVEPGTCIAAWTACDFIDKENGGMLLVPGTHRGNLLCQEQADLGVSFSGGVTKIPPGYKAVCVSMEPGDTLFFGGSVIHGSGPNRTKDRFRRAFIGHYAAGSLEKISKFYLPLVKMDGSEIQVASAVGGGVCGDSWEGGQH